MDISNWITHRANWAPSRIALRFAGTAWSNVEFEERVGYLAAALRAELHIREGDRVAHLGLNSPDLLALFFACARIGAILVPLNWRLTHAEHEYQLGDAAPKAILVEPEYWGHIEMISGSALHSPQARSSRGWGSGCGLSGRLDSQGRDAGLHEIEVAQFYGFLTFAVVRPIATCELAHYRRSPTCQAHNFT